MSERWNRFGHSLLAALYCVCLPALGQSLEDTVTSILKLVTEQSYVQAYFLAQSSQEAWEGEPAFDFAFALAARANRRLDEAAFGFERVLYTQPGHLEARYFLAITYLEMSNLAAAEQELLVLRAQSLPPSLLSRVEDVMDSLQNAKRVSEPHWQNSLDIHAGFDSNPNNGIDEQSITIPLLGTVSLFEENLEHESAFAQGLLSLNYVRPQDQQSRWLFSAAVQHAEFEDTLALSRTFAMLAGGYQSMVGDYRWQGSLYYRPILLDEEGFLDSWGGQFGLSRTAFGEGRWGVDLAYAQEAYDEQPLLDRDQFLLSFWFGKEYTNGSHRLTVKVGDEEADADGADFVDRDLVGAGYRWQHRINGRWQTFVSLDYLRAEHDVPNPLFGEIRDDDFLRAEFEVQYRQLTDWFWSLKWVQMENDSNLPIYEYQRSRVWLGARYEF